MDQALRAMIGKEIQTILEETFRIHHGIYTDKGTSLEETLAGIDAQQASQPQRGHRETIAGHVFHTTFYIRVLLEYLQDLRTGKTDWNESWTVTSVGPAEWARLQEDLLAAYRELLEFVGSAQWDNEDHFGGVLGIVAHCAYHLGAIRQLKEP